MDMSNSHLTKGETVLATYGPTRKCFDLTEFFRIIHADYGDHPEDLSDLLTELIRFMNTEMIVKTSESPKQDAHDRLRELYHHLYKTRDMISGIRCLEGKTPRL